MCDELQFVGKTLLLPSSILRGKGDRVEEYSRSEARPVHHQPGEARLAEDLDQEHASPPPRHERGAGGTDRH